MCGLIEVSRGGRRRQSTAIGVNRAMTEANYRAIVQHYERCLETHGATHKGVDWPNMRDLETRYRVMLDVCKADESRHVVRVNRNDALE